MQVKNLATKKKHLAFVSVDLGDRRTIAACITTAFRARSPTPVYSVGSRYSICEIVLSVPVVQRCLRYSTAQIGSMAHVRPCIAASSSETELASDRSIDRIHDSSLEGRSPRAIHVAAADTEIDTAPARRSSSTISSCVGRSKHGLTVACSDAEPSRTRTRTTVAAR